MSLSSLIRGNSAIQGFATAIPAISATDAHEPGSTVARIATVAVATAQNLEIGYNPAARTVAGIATVAVAKPRNPETGKPPEPPQRQPTDAEAAELRALIRACGEPCGFTESDYQEATERALADADAALLCYRAMAKVEGINAALRQADDDRVTCLACANLNEFQVCRVAHPWTPASACRPARKPVVDILRRCDGFTAKGT